MSLESLAIAKIIEGPIAISAADGDLVAGAAAAALRCGDDVEFDFTGVDVVVTAFLNHAVGGLLEHFLPAELEGRLRYRGATKDVVNRIQLVASNAARYYHEERYRRAVDSVASEWQPI